MSLLFQIPEAAGYVRTIVPLPYYGDDQEFYVGTVNNCILEGSLHGKFNFVIEGHYDELWSLATHPLDPLFVTAGWDRAVSCWDAQEHRMLWRVSLNAQVLSSRLQYLFN